MRKDYFINLFEKYKYEPAIIYNNRKSSYKDLKKKIELNISLVKDFGVLSGDVIAIEGDFSPNSISLLFSLINCNCIIVPINKNANNDLTHLYEISKVQYVLRIDNNDKIKPKKLSERVGNIYYDNLRDKNLPGLVLFSSGTSGEPKVAVHNFSALLEKFMVRRKSLRTINFLLFDHWGGLNTMFHILSNKGVLISLIDRSPENVCRLIQDNKVELLPVSPTFLNLLLVTKLYKKFNLNSLKVISYGTEPMPKTTLKHLNLIFPNVKLVQTYGLIELGVLHSKSKSQDSLWMKVGGDGYQTRIVDGILQIKAKSAMLGYLNAKSPFTDDGWFVTGDEVLEKDGYIKVLGRKSEIINVGGEKVYPQEIENVILKLDEIADVTVYGEKNSIMGNIVCADIKPLDKIDKKILIKKVKKHCKQKLLPFKVPLRITVDDKDHHGERFKKLRSNF